MSENLTFRPTGRGFQRASAAALALAIGGAPAFAQPAATATQSPTTQTPPAQAEGRPQGQPQAQRPAANETEDETTVSEVVVNGRRDQYGAVVGDIKPEVQLSPADIQSFGVSTVTDLLSELGPEVRSDRGRGGSQPVILLNGRRISSFHEIENIPTEAILRVDILPEEVSLKYGYTADQRVVNIVLRRRFRAVTGEIKGGGATEGGEVMGQAEADLLRLRNDNRLNLDLKFQGNSNLLDSERGIDPSAGAFSVPGNVISTQPGQQIDPNLSALAGKPVYVAGVPVSAAQTAPKLSDFAATAGVPTTSNIGADRTLVAANQSLILNGVLARSTLGGIGLTLNGSLSTNQSNALLGLPIAGLTLPVGNPYSPFSQPVMVDRYVTGFGPLTQTANGWSGHLGVTANKDWKGWRLSLTGAYDHSDALTVSEVGLNTSLAQAQLNAGSTSFNPYAPLPKSLFSLLAENKGRGVSDQANVQFLGNGPLWKLPAGDLYASLKFGETIQSFASRTDRFGLRVDQKLWRSDLNAQLNIDLPVLKHTMDHGLGVIGDLSLSSNVAVDKFSDFGTLWTIGYGVNWSPWKPLNIIFSHTRDHLAPSIQQLGNPLVTTPGVQVLDPLTGQTVTVTTLSGGNRALKDDSREVMKLGIAYRPWADKEATLTANYIWSDIKNSIFSVPGSATPQIAADFPNAYIRNSQGQLIAVNETPQNLADQSRQEVRWGFNFATPVGPPPKPEPNSQRSPGRGEGQGGQGQAGQGQTSQGQGERAQAGAPGGQRGGGGFGGFNRAQQQGRFQFAIYHTVFFKDQVLATPGSPVLDLLNGGATGSSGGQVRHELEGQLGFTKNGYGVRVSANWKSATKVEGGTPTEDLIFSQIATANLRLWDNFGVQPKLVKAHPWLRGARLTLEVNNLFDTRQSVRDALGVTPQAYLPGYVNPTGRTVEISLRKLFF